MESRKSVDSRYSEGKEDSVITGQAVGTQLSQGKGVERCKSWLRSSRARTVMLPWGMGLEVAEKGQMQSVLGITYHMNTEEPESEWPYSPTLRKDLCCMVTPVFLQVSRIPSSTAIINTKGTSFLPTLITHQVP